MPYFWSIASLILYVYCTNVNYEAHIKGFQIMVHHQNNNNKDVTSLRVGMGIVENSTVRFSVLLLRFGFVTVS